jgi:hypothetical protein
MSLPKKYYVAFNILDRVIWGVGESKDEAWADFNRLLPSPDVQPQNVAITECTKYMYHAIENNTVQSITKCDAGVVSDGEY